MMLHVPGAQARLAPVPMAEWRRTPHRDRLVSLGWFLALALLLRLEFLGSPIQHIDEQFYLLVADRMAHGAWPYVDIWDRKPIGLFLIFRAAVALPGNPVVWAQAFGLVAAVATAAVLERMALLVASPLGARLAGLAYLAFMPVFNCGYAQSPVFYNLPVAMAALVVIRATLSSEVAQLGRQGAIAMALLGMALQIKYTSIFEGLALGLLLLWHSWRRGLTLPRLASHGTLWAIIAATPTALALLVYVLAGHGDAFIQANFLSVFNKTMRDGGELTRVAQATLILSPFAVAALLGPKGDDSAALGRIRYWALAAIGGYAAIGHWYDHYVGALIPPIAVLAAPMLGRVRWYRGLLFGVALVTNAVVGIDRYLNDGTTAEAEAATRRILAELHGGCFYQYQGQTALYRLTGACIPTRFPFPDHLSTAPEAKALGVDVLAEQRAIMASRPAVVLVDDDPHPDMQNAATRAIVDDGLARNYGRVGVIPIGRHRYGFWRIRR